jgi:GTP cyclohydrolase IA
MKGFPMKSKVAVPPTSALTSLLESTHSKTSLVGDAGATMGSKDLGQLAAGLILTSVGEDIHREGLVRTPERFSKAMRELCSGYSQTVESVVGQGIFDAEDSGMVSVRNIEFFSLCEHHILPFWGSATVAYYPGKKLLGLSKVGRIVDVFARRLQVQERLTRQVAEGIAALIAPRAVAVRMQASHMCMMMRGVEKNQSHTVTEKLVGLENLTEVEKQRLLQALETK